MNQFAISWFLVTLGLILGCVAPPKSNLEMSVATANKEKATELIEKSVSNSSLSPEEKEEILSQMKEMTATSNPTSQVSFALDLLLGELIRSEKPPETVAEVVFSALSDLVSGFKNDGDEIDELTLLGDLSFRIAKNYEQKQFVIDALEKLFAGGTPGGKTLTELYQSPAFKKFNEYLSDELEESEGPETANDSQETEASADVLDTRLRDQMIEILMTRITESAVEASIKDIAREKLKESLPSTVAKENSERLLESTFSLLFDQSETNEIEKLKTIFNGFLDLIKEMSKQHDFYTEAEILSQIVTKSKEKLIGDETLLKTAINLYFFESGRNFTVLREKLESTGFALIDRTLLMKAKKNGPCFNSKGGDWVYVPADADYQTDEFCIMKFEAKKGEELPISVPEGKPWNNLTQNSAKTECEKIGSTYTLMGPKQYTVLSANLALVAKNWTLNLVGSGSLVKGHIDNDPPLPCEASDDDMYHFVEGDDCTGLTAGEGEDNEGELRRTHFLSTGQIIWDIGGNLREWVDYYAPTGKPLTKPGFDTVSWASYANLNDGEETELSLLIPNQNIKADWNDDWGDDHGVGRLWLGVEGEGGALYRSSSFVIGDERSGIFSGGIHRSNTHRTTAIGFRCVNSDIAK